MGGSPNLLMPVTPSYTASWASHTRRSPKSSEPGTDMFVPIGTPVYAPGDGSIYGAGHTIGPATGRWVGIDLDNGLRFRCMHLSRLKRTTGRVRRGELLGYSGASGYGYEDWSHLPGMPAAHTHVTLWPSQVSRYGYDRNGKPFTVDFMKYVGGSAAAVTPPQEDDMFPAVLEIEGDSNAGKSLYDLRTGRAIRAISKAENSSLRKAEAKGMCVYVSVPRAEYKTRGGK